MTSSSLLEQLYQSIRMDMHELGEDVARLEVHGNSVVGSHLVQGLSVDVDETADGIAAVLRVAAGSRIRRPVHMCFGLLPEEGLQKIDMHVEIEEDAAVSVLAHCTFPNAVDVRHEMDADIRVAPGARYSYFERHVHGPNGGVTVVPKAHVDVAERASFRTEFELIRGRVGRMDIDYETVGHAGSVTEMTARISGREDDFIRLNEVAHLTGEGARGVLTSHIAVRERAQALIENTLRADAPYARGHVDCKEIVQGDAVARAVPIVEVRHPKAHVTHEAAIGSVDTRQLETLMARGLDEESAVELIIDGLLSAATSTEG